MSIVIKGTSEEAILSALTWFPTDIIIIILMSDNRNIQVILMIMSFSSKMNILWLHLSHIWPQKRNFQDQIKAVFFVRLKTKGQSGKNLLFFCICDWDLFWWLWMHINLWINTKIQHAACDIFVQVHLPMWPVQDCYQFLLETDIGDIWSVHIALDCN